MSSLSSNLAELFGKLDLLPHIASLEHFFSREQNIAMQGDQERHYRYIQALDALDFKAPPKSVGFESIINHLKKQGVLRFEEIHELLKVVRYFRLMRNHECGGLIGEWMGTIIIPEPFNDIDEYFDYEGTFIESRDEEPHKIVQRIKAIKTEINEQIKRLFHTQKLTPYLVDTQIHYINDEETLLVRGGFNHVLKGSVVGRTGAGFFYVAPDSVLRSKEQLRYVLQERESKLYEYAKRFSAKLSNLVPFIGFCDREFDRYDHYQARVLFARSRDFAILKPQNNGDIVLEEFSHPAIHKPKPISVTTHHKRLAALMADRDDVELMAALYDEERRLPTYEFLQGVIGKSYAFETATRYGINPAIITRAKALYGENHEKLSVLIERGSELERELKRKNREVDERLESLKSQESALKEAREHLRVELDAEKAKLRTGYDEAIREAKEAAKGMDMAAIHRQLNKAQAKLPKVEPIKIAEPEQIKYEVGQTVKYRTQRGSVVSVGAKDAMIEVEGMRLRVKLTDLKPSGNLPKKPKVTVTSQIDQKSGLKLDLHRSE